MKGHKGKFANRLSPLWQFFNWLVDWLGGVPSGTVCGGVQFRIMLPPVSSANSQKQINNPDKSLSEPSRICSNQLINGVPNSFKALLANAFPDENGCKSVVKWLTYQTDTFQVTIEAKKKKKQYKNSKKTLKKHALISFRLRKLEDSGYVVATHYKSARNLPTNIMEPTDKHQQPLNLHLTSGTCSLGIFQRLSRTCKTKRWKNSYQNDVIKFK